MTDLARAVGRMVAVPLGAVARARHGRPMHPRGAVFDAVLERAGSAPAWGVPWLDEHGRDDVVVRLSRGAGLPAPLPDLLGLALRVRGDAEPVDLLLSSAGRSALGRLLPVPRRNAATSYGSIMGYRSDVGVLRFAAAGDGKRAPSEPAPLAAAVLREGLEFSPGGARCRSLAALRPPDCCCAPRSPRPRPPVRRRPPPTAGTRAGRAARPLPPAGVRAGTGRGAPVMAPKSVLPVTRWSCVTG